MDLPTSTLDKLKCSSCKYHLSIFPIHSYKNGNSACGRCPLNSPKVIRQIAYETIAHLVNFPCKNQHFGCNQMSTPEQMKTHEEECKYRPWICSETSKWSRPLNTFRDYYKSDDREVLMTARKDIEEARPLVTAEQPLQKSKNIVHCSIKVTTYTFSDENTATGAQLETQMNNLKVATISQSNCTFTAPTKSNCSFLSPKLTPGQQVVNLLREEQSMGQINGSSQYSQKEDLQQQQQELDIRLVLKSEKRLDDNLKLPKNFKVGQAITDGNCFFDSFGQGLKQQLGIIVTVEQLRQYCREFAQNNPPKWFINCIANSHDNNGVVRIETPDSYTKNILNSNRWGDFEVEGRILCEKYRVKLHVIEKHSHVDGEEVRTDQIVDSKGSKSVNNINYNEENTIHIVNGGHAHFEPVLRIGETEHHEQSSYNFSDYDDDDDDDEMTPDTFYTCYNSSDSEEEMLTKIKKRFKKEPTPNIKLEDTNNPLYSRHIHFHKGKCKVTELLIEQVATFNDDNINNKLNLTPLNIVNRFKGQGFVQVLEANHKNPSQVDTLSKQQRFIIRQSLHKDKLRTFVKYFVFIYETYLSEYYNRLENQIAKSGKVADFLNKLNKIAKSNKTKKSIVGFDVLLNIISSAGTCYNRKELSRLINQLDVFKVDLGKVRAELVKSSVDVFRSFESQFVQVTADGSWQKAMAKLAEDAVGRAIMHYKENTKDDFSAQSITKGILLGESKRYKDTSTGISHIKQGHTLENENSKLWNTSELFDKAGLVVIKSGGSAQYYNRKGKKSDTTKYGYRLPLKWESEDRLGLTKTLNAEYQKEEHPREGYTYILKPDEKLNEELLKNINNQDPELIQERLIKKIKQEIKQDAEEYVNKLEKLISNNFDKLSSYMQNYQNYIKDFVKRIEQQNNRKEISRHNKKIATGVEHLNQGLNNLQNGHKVVTNVERPLGKTYQNKNPIWFDVRNPLTSFTALSLGGKGRQDTLDQVADGIQQGIVVISGLDGVGKSELAIKYAHDHSKYYEGNVIWIDAETQQTLKKSFSRVAKEKLNISIDNKSIKSINENVYEYFANGKSLFIFDNAKEYSLVKCFLPLSLSPDANKPNVLITSPNNLEWQESAGENITALLSLGDFTDVEAIEFVKKVLEIKDENQNQDITEFVKKLHTFPLALQQAVAYIKDTNNAYKKINLEFKISDYINKYEKTSKNLLDVKVLTGTHIESTFKTLKVTLDKIKNEEYGQQSINMLNIICYFASNNIPGNMFLSELASGNEDKLFAITNLLEKYSIIRLENGMLSVHGLAQQVRRLELVLTERGRKLEEKTLTKALRLLKNHMKDRNSIEYYTSHVRSAWNYAINYDKLIESFIVNDIDDEAAYIPYFHLIAECSSYEVVKAIINKVEQNYSHKLNAVINAQDKDRGMALHNAALSGDERIVKLLIEKGANVNAKKKHGWTPLHLAATNGYLEVLKVLLDNNAKVSDKTGYKFTSLHLAARNGYPEVVKFLLSKDADINAQDQNKYTPLHFAVMNNHFEVVRALLEDNEINVNAETEFKLTPLHFAAREGIINTVNVLLEKYSDVNIKDTCGFTPLHLAAINGHTEVVNNLLKESEIDINTQTTEGNTPLHLAAKKGNLEVVKALIAWKANITVKNNNGEVASDLAHEKNHFKVENYIIPNLDTKEVLISENAQSKYNRRPGAAGIGGQLYEIELSMLFLLRGVTRKVDKTIVSFYLATNMKEAADFDDVVFKYKYKENEVEKSKIIFLQAKHKETEKNEKDTKKEKKITIDTLLSQSEKGDFILRKYLSSYKKIKLLKDHLIFKDGIESCDFVIYTNALPNFDKTRDSAEEEYVERKHMKPGDFLYSIVTLNESDCYYKLNAAEKVMDALRHSLDFEILVKELASSFSSGSIDGNKLIFKDYQVSIAERVIEKNIQGEGRVRDDFLDSEKDEEFRIALFKELTKNKQFANKSANKIKEELRGKNIQLPSQFECGENALKLPLPSKLFSDEEIKEFLNELKLFVNQPNESRLGEMIKGEIRKEYKVEEQDIDSVFSEVEYRVRKWWKEGNDYLRESNTFFQEAARFSIKFDVKDSVILFTGRSKELEYLHKLLKNEGEHVISQMASVIGLGGIGKSELARDYVKRHSKDYDDNVIWINADNYLTTAESFHRLAKDKLKISTTNINNKEKDITLIVEDVYSFFAKRHRKCLFVFDNAGKYKTVKEADEGIDKFLPSGSNKPTVLITSRNQEWGSSIAPLQLGVFTEKEAVEFIKKSFEIEDGLEERDIRSLAKDLQYLPLALHQAVGYINKENQRLHKWGKNKFTVSKYLDLYEETVEELLNTTSGGTSDHYTKTVLTTWEITIDKIKQRNGRRGRQALQIFDIIAYLAPDQIPIEGIFSKLIDSEEELHSAVELLDQYSLAKLEQGSLNIHRLVQQVTRIKIAGRNEEGAVLRKALTFLKEPVEKKESFTGSIYISHAVSAWDYASKHDELVQEFSKLPGLVIENLDESVRYQEAHLFGKRVSQVLLRVMGPGHEDTLTARCYTADALNEHGKYVEALEISREVYEKSKQTLGYKHHRTLSIQNVLASVLINLGEYNEALKIFKDLLSVFKDNVLLDHPNIIYIKKSIGNIKNSQGKYDEALKCFKEIYEIDCNSALGPYHPRTLSIRTSIADTYLYLGKCDEALQIFSDVYEKTKDIMGLDHPLSLTVRYNMAAVYLKQDKYKEALQAFSEVYEIRKRDNNLGSDHPDTLETQSIIASILAQQGEYNEAVKVNNDIYEKLVKKLGPDHYLTLTTMNNKAFVLYYQENDEEALNIFNYGYERSKEVLGHDHPLTLNFQNGVATVLSSIGKYDEAFKMFERLYDLQIKTVGPDHPDTLFTLETMAYTICKQGNYDEALQIIDEVCRKRKENHLDTSSASDVDD